MSRLVCRRAGLRGLLAALSCAGAAACHEPPDSRVICHNSNCAEPTDPAQDNTLEAMERSLALRFRGRPVIDGIEMDLVWYGAGDRCLFAHDLEDLSITAPASAAAERLAAYLGQPGQISWNGDSFSIFVELKGYVGNEKTDKHSPEQRRAHVECALDVFEELDAAATAAGRNLEVIFTSFDPKLLADLYDSPRWPTQSTARARLGIVTGVPSPLDVQTHRLSDFRSDLPIDLLEAHSDWLLDGQREAYDSLGYDISLWMFSATSEIFDAIERYKPSYVGASEAMLLRRWLEH